ncbi:sugar phosphate isomerase/epimerase family protein [Amphibacillus cookii]|uniref:sugar phosphate isomerase/epimerase family protein n=1 Tax=Amphibacillus cookii TaxID=767787 RepID=UPI00195E2455|nr:sugar phosphate isomerase/epimerase family protein [Amphibacillus cookii]MBM7541573.1 sugar phosphate isomerase/epimerase [Amphibacillus cookii]
MNIGIRAHDVENKDILDLAQKLNQKEIHSIQLALKKSVKEWQISTASLNTGLAKYIANILHDKKINIAVLGCYINMIDPDLEQREQALDYFKAHLRLASDFGCSIVGSETGNVHSQMGYTTDNFTEAAFLKVVDSVQILVEEAERFGVIVGIEGGVNHPIYTPQLMKRLIDEVSSNHLQVIFDPVNYLTLDNYQRQMSIIDEAFSLFGDRIAIIHAKDFQIKDGQLYIVPVGHGQLNYAHLFTKIKVAKPMIPILLEETKEPYINQSIAKLTQIYHR